MTKEEAIEFIAQSVKSDIDMAKVADAIKALEQEPCEVAISRSEALKMINNMVIPEDMCTFEIMSHIGVEIGTLPSVQPKSKTGHWIDITNKNKTVIAVRCSCCEKSPKYAIKSDFCPNCGAKMVEPQESEDKE